MLKTKQSQLIIFSLSLWIMYFCATIFLSGFNPAYNGYLYFCGQFFLDIAISFSFFIHAKYNQGINRFVFNILGAAFLFSAASDGVYNYLININQITPKEITEHLYEIPFLLFLIMSAIGISIFTYLNVIKDRKSGQGESKLLSLALMIIILVSISFFSISWEIGYWSEDGIYQIIETISESIIFSLSLILLITSRKIYYSTIATGFLIVCASDLIIRASFVQGITLKDSVIESFWVLGLSLIAIGLFLKKNNPVK